MIKPQVVIGTYKPLEYVTKEVVAGIEEEGVLYEVIECQEPKDIMDMAREALRKSTLEVGIGIQAEEVVLVATGVEEGLVATSDRWRDLGHNAARYVKGKPFKNRGVE